MSDKLTEALATSGCYMAQDYGAEHIKNMPDCPVCLVDEAARRWASYPTDEDVERAHSVLREVLPIPDPFSSIAVRAALEAVKREDR